MRHIFLAVTVKKSLKSEVITELTITFDKLVSSSYVDEYQFGFKAKHSTGLVYVQMY